MRQSGEDYGWRSVKQEMAREAQRHVMALDFDGERTALLLPVHKTLLEVLRKTNRTRIHQRSC
jgi:hypothetical protein